MPVHYVLKTGFKVTSTEPTDWMYINPCFRDEGATSDPDQLCEDWATALDGWNIQGPGAMTINVKAYDLEGTPPVYPAGEFIKNPTASVISYAQPRELAVCLSFYGDHNIPRKRGRLYIPHQLAVSTNPTLRPATATMTKVMALGPLLSNLGGIDVDWIVWSRTNSTAEVVKNYWVDDEWDTVRSRGLLRTTRQTATTSG